MSVLPFARAVLEYTNFYIRFGFGRDFDPTPSRWQEYLAGLLGTDDRPDWTYRFYMTRSYPVAPPGLVATFGCFSYARLSSDRIRLHLQDGDRDGRSLLATERRDRRVAELAALFADVKRITKDAVLVSVKVVQRPRIPASVSRLVPGDRSCDRGSLSAHAALGPVREPVRRGQKGLTSAFRSRCSR